MAAIDFEKLVETYYQALFRFALSLSGREEEACDLTQQTFFRWASKGHQLRDRTKVKSWLFTTLHREFLISRRRQSRFPHIEVSQVEHELPRITPSMVNEMDGNLMMETLLNVDDLYRAPLILFYSEDHSYQEIADILDIPVGTVMSRLSRGKNQLRRLLEISSRKNRGGSRIFYRLTCPSTRSSTTMDKQEAQFILEAYRPGGQDADDPMIHEALAWVDRDPELAAHFAAQRQLDRAIADKIRQTPVPADLQVAILAGKRIGSRHPLKPRLVWPAAAAILLIGLSLLFFRGQEQRFETWSHEMVQELYRPIDNLQPVSTLVEVENFFARSDAPMPLTLPDELQSGTPAGCKIYLWDDHKISLICFRFQDQGVVHLFVADRIAFPGARFSGLPIRFRSGDWVAACWLDGDKAYVLSSRDPNLLDRLL